MKVFLVRTERDGNHTKEDGKRVTEIVVTDRRYYAETIQEVWDEIHNGNINLYEETITTVHQEHNAIFPVSGKGE
jgi:hypothetical protein